MRSLWITAVISSLVLFGFVWMEVLVDSENWGILQWSMAVIATFVAPMLLALSWREAIR